MPKPLPEAVQRPRMRFVPIKTEEQLDLQAPHRVRERWVMRRTTSRKEIVVNLKIDTKKS